MFKKASMLTLLSLSIMLTGCASIVSGTNQPVSVTTGPILGAQCSLENNKGSWFIPSTPGTVVVHRSFNDLQVNCSKRGFMTSSRMIPSNTKIAVAGNAIFGGLIGVGVDAADGAAYDYPNNIDVQMQRA